MRDLLNHRVMFYDRLKNRILPKKKGLSVGWSGPFPPAPNGAAASNYWFLREMMAQRSGWNFYPLPWGKCIDKTLFKACRYSHLNDPDLDILFFSLDDTSLKEAQASQSFKIYQQTYHDYLDSPEDIVERGRHADVMIAPTRWTRDLYIKAGASRVEYLPYGVDTRYFKPQAKIQNQFEVLFVSRIMYYKGILPFLRALPFVLKAIPDVVFQINGVFSDHDVSYTYPNGNAAQISQEVRSEIEQMQKKYPNHLKFTKEWLPYEEAGSIYRNADLLVFPSHNEGFGIPMIEAMACGVPCLVPDKYPMKEIVRHNETGMCLPTHMGPYGMEFPCERDIAEAVIDLYHHKKKYQQLSENARDHVCQHYDLKNVVAQLAELMESGIKDKGA